MEGSASEPVLGSESFDYTLPAHGIGATGHPKKVQLGFTNTDTGEHTSRINVIAKQAAKVPGPGKYIGHSEWKQSQCYKFASSSREYKPMHKNPAPVHYESKDFVMSKGIGARDNTSNHPKIQFGKVMPGKRKSFLDGAIKHGSSMPGPGSHNPPSGCSNSLGVGPRKMVSWDKEKAKSRSMKVKVPELAPNHYNINYSKTEPAMPDFTVAKEGMKGGSKNFITKAVAETSLRDTGVDATTGRPPLKYMPGPGAYNTQDVNLDRTSRGTYHLQLRGLTRGPASGYF